MKPRKVEIRMVVETDAQVKDLTEQSIWQYVFRVWKGGNITKMDVLQIQATVIKGESLSGVSGVIDRFASIKKGKK